MNFEKTIEELRQYISFASVSTDPLAKSGMDGARHYAANRLRKMGFEVEEIVTPKHPILVGKRITDPSHPHVLIYGHYDVQPADPLNLWSSPAFEAEVRGNRIYGRGAADNKGPQIVHMEALEQVLKDDPDIPLSITYFIEGEEEIGSPSFQGFLEFYQDSLKEADFVLLSDTGSPSPDQIVVTTALRGLIGFHVDLIGPRSDLHSGIHGGAIRNPIQALSLLLSSLHNKDGSVNIPGFYDDVVAMKEWEREEFTKLEGDDESYRKFLGVDSFYTPPGLGPREAVRYGPTLEINGVGGGFQGEGTKTVIPSRAFAKITCRLVGNQDAQKIETLLQETLIKRCPSGVKINLTPTGRGDPYLVEPPKFSTEPSSLTPTLQRAFSVIENVIEKEFSHPPLFLREGGSVPIIADLKKKLGLDTLMIGLFTAEDNLHAPDESFHLGTMKKAIKSFTHFFKELAKK